MKDESERIEKLALYEDEYLKITAIGITIFKYYFPLGSSKFILFEQI
jgi:hypothetical protein